MWVATIIKTCGCLGQLTPPIRAATDLRRLKLLINLISTHTTHVGGDAIAGCKNCNKNNFNSHNPCGWQLHSLPITCLTGRFQLTPPMWVATVMLVICVILIIRFQLTPPMWVATSFLIYIVQHYRHFNSHHPCGWRHLMTVSNLRRKRFQLTPPMRAATFVPDSCFKLIGISTHATHEGGDRDIFRTVSVAQYFNSRHP